MKKQKAIAILLIVVMLLSMIPTSVFADSYNSGVLTIDSDFETGFLEEKVEETQSDPSAITTLNILSPSSELNSTDLAYIQSLGNLTVLNISSTITVGAVGDNFFLENSTIQSVTMPATSFGSEAFNSCSSLTTVNLPNVVQFSGHAFYNCDMLTSVSMPSVTTFSGQAFYDCDGLTTISLPLAETFSQSAFDNCDTLASVSLPNATTFGDSAFYACGLLTTISLPSVTTIGNNAFYGSNNLTSFTADNLQTVGTYFLTYCSSLTTLSLPALTALQDSSICYDTALTTVSMPNVTTVGTNCFLGCTLLANVTLTNTETIGNNAFNWGNGNYCISLTSISLPSLETLGESCFQSVTNLTSIYCPNATSIGAYSFLHCASLTTVDMPAVETIYRGAFSYCDSLTTLSFPNATTIERNFCEQCGSLTTVNLPSATTFYWDIFYVVPSTITMTLPATVPTTYSSLGVEGNSFAVYDPGTKSAVVKVPYSSQMAYDLKDGSSDGYYYGWEIQISTCDVTYDSNGGSAVATETVTYNTTATEPSDPTKTGLTFGGWYVDSELTTPYNFETAVTTSLILYAKWTCTITYNGNESTGGEAPIDGTIYTEGTNATTLNQNTLYKIGYTFDGWNTQPDGMGYIYISDYTFEIFENMTLYAMWDKNLYNVTYQAGTNGSFLGETSPTGEFVYYMESPDEVPTVIADEGYVFVGWAMSAGTGFAETPKTGYLTTEQVEALSIDGNVDFTAVYEELNSYTVTFDSNGGSAVSSQTVYDGSLATEPTEPTKEGYIFNGWWYDGTEAAGLWDFDENTVTDNMTLYADWIVDNSGADEVQKGNITLTLTDKNGNPLAYYPVELHSTVIKATTDANGQVTFANVTLENHELVIFDKEGNELGTINLNMTESDTNTTSVNGNDVAISFNESAVSIDIEISVSDEGVLTVNEVLINANPKTGAIEAAVYISEGSDVFNIIPLLSILLVVSIVGGVFIIRKKYSKQ